MNDITLDAINSILCRWTERDNMADVLDSTTLAALELDSIDIVEMLVDIEAEFHIHFNERDYDQLHTLGDLRNITRSKYVTDKRRQTTQNQV